MNKTSIKVLFALFIPFLFLQFIFVLKVKEPYPSVRLPGFGNVPDDPEVLNDIKDIDVVAYFQDGDSLVLEEKVFFNTMQEWHISKIMNSLGNKRGNNDKKKGKEQEINLGNYTVSVSLRRYNYEDKLPAFKTWLKKRTHAVTGRTDVASLRLTQYDQEFIISTRTFGDKSIDKSITYLFDDIKE